jgi:hypothetical protein
VRQKNAGTSAHESLLAHEPTAPHFWPFQVAPSRFTSELPLAHAPSPSNLAARNSSKNRCLPILQDGRPLVLGGGNRGLMAVYNPYCAGVRSNPPPEL